MLIKKIHLKNWKNFHKFEADLGYRVFLIGPNASGKSNFLDAFRFLRDVANSGLGKAVNEVRGGVSAIRCLAARKYSNVDVEVSLGDGDHIEWRYRLSFSQDNQQRPVVKEEVVYRQNKEIISQRPNPVSG